MPHAPRLDYPGALHHLIVRGIERGRIFRTDDDRALFLELLSARVLASSAGLYAWARMPNHAHVLLRTGSMPISSLVHDWLGGFPAGCYHRKLLEQRKDHHPGRAIGGLVRMFPGAKLAE